MLDNTAGIYTAWRHSINGHASQLKYETHAIHITASIDAPFFRECSSRPSSETIEEGCDNGHCGTFYRKKGAPPPPTTNFQTSPPPLPSLNPLLRLFRRSCYNRQRYPRSLLLTTSFFNPPTNSPWITTFPFLSFSLLSTYEHASHHEYQYQWEFCLPINEVDP